VIALVGQSVIDRVTLPGYPPVERLGGAPIFAAQAVARAGAHAVILTRGATAVLRRPLQELGLPIIVGQSTRSCISEMELRPDGSCADSFAAFGEPFTPADVAGWMEPGLRGTSLVVCGAQWRADFSAETLAALAASGRRIYLDGQGPLRAPQLGPVCLEPVLTPALLQHVAVLKLAEEEALVALGGFDAEAARALGVLVVVTRGDKGAIVLADGAAIEVGVEPVLGLADTVGAGDAFLALMAVEETRGAPVVEAVRRACAGVAAMLRERLTQETADPSRGPGGAAAPSRAAGESALPSGSTAGPDPVGVRRSRPGEALLFDFGGTLDADGVTWRERVRRLFAREGIPLRDGEFDAAFYTVDDRLTGRIPITLSFRDTVDQLITGVADALRVRDDTIRDRVARQFLDEALACLASRASLLRRLAGPYRLGVVSNFYGNLATVCADAGIAGFFDVLVDSAQVGCRKPDPLIFHHALERLDVPASRAVFVGDSLGRDMAGARGVGMRHIWLRAATADGGPCCADDRVVLTLGALEGLLL
jgi:putative hydrolase of the HAD superfamily